MEDPSAPYLLSTLCLTDRNSVPWPFSGLCCKTNSGTTSWHNFFFSICYHHISEYCVSWVGPPYPWSLCIYGFNQLWIVEFTIEKYLCISGPVWFKPMHRVSCLSAGSSQVIFSRTLVNLLKLICVCVCVCEHT